MKNCSKDTNRCSKPNKCCHNHLFDLLEKLDAEFKKHDINYILHAGTLLGCVREGDIISSDTDIDIIIMKYDLAADGVFHFKDPSVSAIISNSTSLMRIYCHRKIHCNGSECTRINKIVIGYSEIYFVSKTSNFV